ncbi:MAG: Gfo/Idh/MocA family protein [Acetanaerobacterium sp.]
MKQIKVGVIGCGVISDIYLKNLTTRFSTLKVVACADAFAEKSRERAQQYGIAAVSVDDLLADSQIDVILNLTNPQFHAEISLAAIKNGKHVYSEKPLATNPVDAQRIMDAAAEKNLRVGCAPDTFLGAGLQTACKAVADGWIGRPLAAVAFVSSRGHERWHSNPGFYYQEGGGPHLDMGPYYITALTAALGRVKRVNAMSGRGFDTRIVGTGPLKGERIPVNVDTHIGATLEFDCGVIATVMMSFDIWATSLPFLEIYGTSGTLTLPDPNTFDGPVRLKSMNEQAFEPLPLLYPFTGNLRGLGLAQMCHAILHGEEHCANGAIAQHVLEVLDAMEHAAKSGETVECHTPGAVPPMLTPGLMEVEYGF